MRRATKERIKKILCRFCSWRRIAKCPKIKECVQRFTGNNCSPISIFSTLWQYSQEDRMKKALCKFCSWQGDLECHEMKDCAYRIVGNDYSPVYGGTPNSPYILFPSEHIPNLKLPSKKDRDIAYGMSLLYSSELY
jgi:hypothetical protein